MRICFLCRNGSAVLQGQTAGFGGSEVDMVNVARELAACHDVEVDLVTVTRQPEQSFVWNNIRVRPVPDAYVTHEMPRLRRLLRILQYFMRVLLQCTGSRADVYYAKIASLETLVAWAAAKLRRRPFVFRFSSDWETNIDSLRTRIFSASPWAVRWFLFALRHTELAIAQTSVQQENIARNLGVPSIVIPNGHVIPDNPIDYGNKREVLWVARCHPQKHADLYLKLAAALPHIPFTLILLPAPEYPKLFDEIADGARSLQNVTIIPGVAHDEILDFYRRARVVVLTSDVEGFSNVIIEAFKTATPVASLFFNPDDILTQPSGNSNESYFGRILRDRVVGTCSEGDFDHLVKQVEKYYSDEVLWRRTAENALDFARECFSIDVVAKAYRQQFSALVSRRGTHQERAG